MKIAYVTPEVLPYSKTGGLADVSLALPTVLSEQGLDLTVFSPYYPQARDYLARSGTEIEESTLPYELWIGGESWPVKFASTPGPGPRHVFVINDHYFDRPHPYLDEHGRDYHDNVARFSYFCRAVLEFLRHVGPAPEVIHCHDWQTALIPVYLKTTDRGEEFAATRTVLTIHNLGYQGVFPADQLLATGLDWDVFTQEQMEFYDNLNLLKGGIALADALTTVSPTYAREIQTAEFGHGLEGFLANHSNKLTGILNGIDTRVWNPAGDQHLPATYSAKSLGGKKTCRRLLQREFDLPLRSGCLLLGVISRLDHQKGIDLLAGAVRRLATLDFQLVVLGSGDPGLEEELTALAADFPDQVAVRLGYDEPLAHRIIAGIDAFIMPSRYEPCGLTQLYSHAYGTIPVVRRTGGLADTVVDYTPRRLARGTASGFVFDGADPARLEDALRRAAGLFFTDNKAWGRLKRQVMQLDHSWAASARRYSDLYHRLAANPALYAGDPHG